MSLYLVDCGLFMSFTYGLGNADNISNFYTSVDVIVPGLGCLVMSFKYSLGFLGTWVCSTRLWMSF